MSKSVKTILSAEYIRNFLYKNFSESNGSRYFNYWSEGDMIFSFTPENCNRYKIELERRINKTLGDEYMSRKMLDDYFIEFLTYHFPMLKDSGWRIIIYHPQGRGFGTHTLGGHQILGNLIKL